ncbi:MAG TPA: RNase adapter RapZ [Pseudomonadales bacterium]|nr:RNase adapter RapZ [Pseudomonadales bacterium]
MRLVVISGRSGSGKSTALHVLEDEGFYCIDNLPAGLLGPLVEQMQQEGYPTLKGIAVSIDARNTGRDLALFPSMLIKAREQMDCEVIYLDARQSSLIKRFSETRRKHPLSGNGVDLAEAIDAEKSLLEPIADLASLTIDTSNLNLYQLRDLVLGRVAQQSGAEVSLLFMSFGYKHGIPVDADLVFDVRCLPNPYWKHELRAYTGRDQPVIEFLDAETEVQTMRKDIYDFLQKWLPAFKQNRRYLTVAIGCTGGQHRSVYLCEKLHQQFLQQYAYTQVRHRELAAVR